MHIFLHFQILANTHKSNFKHHFVKSIQFHTQSTLLRLRNSIFVFSPYDFEKNVIKKYQNIILHFSQNLSYYFQYNPPNCGRFCHTFKPLFQCFDHFCMVEYVSCISLLGTCDFSLKTQS